VNIFAILIRVLATPGRDQLTRPFPTPPILSLTLPVYPLELTAIMCITRWESEFCRVEGVGHRKELDVEICVASVLL
jgi:hypothetical protein